MIKLKEKISYDHLTRCRKVLDNIQQDSMVKVLEQSETCPKMIKALYSKPVVNVNLKERNSEQFH